MLALKRWYLQLRQKMVIDPIVNDPRENGGANTRLGRPVYWIFDAVIRGGQANFDEPIDEFSPRDRVMLYAFFNQKGHVEELVHAFQKLWPNPTRLRGTTIVDVGCGPFTAGLALANVVDNAAPINYFGIDTSTEMLKLAAELEKAARDIGGLHQQSKARFFGSVSDIPVSQLRAGPVCVILSYLLASDSLDVATLINEVLSFCNKASLGSISVLYTNAVRETARAKYPLLRTLLVDAGFEVVVEGEDVLNDGSKPRNVHYALFYRPHALEISIDWLVK